MALLHLTDLHFHEVIVNPVRLMNKRFLANLNVWLRRRHVFRQERAEEFADYLCSLGIREVLITGDFTCSALEEEFVRARRFLEYLRDKGLAPIILPGNHDVYTYESVRQRRYSRCLADFLPPEPLPCLLRLEDGMPLLLVPTVKPNPISARGYISAEDLFLLKELLSGVTEETILVAGHYPLLDRTPTYHSGPMRQLRQAATLRRILGRSGKRVLYMAGHEHRFSYVADPRYRKMQHLVSRPLFLLRSREGIHGGFSEIRWEEDGFRVWEHVNSEGWEKQSVEAFPMAE